MAVRPAFAQGVTGFGDEPTSQQTHMSSSLEARARSHSKRPTAARLWLEHQHFELGDESSRRTSQYMHWWRGRGGCRAPFG